MLRHIEIDVSVEKDVGYIIKKDDLKKRYKSNDIVSAAQRNAKRIVLSAESTSNEITHAAWSEGYVAGINLSVQTLAKFVSDHEGHKNSIITGALKILTTRFENFFSCNEVICELLSSLTDHLNHELTVPAKITVALPEKVNVQSVKIKNIFAAAGLVNEIKKSPNSTIAVEYGDEIWTCDLPAVANDIAKSAIKEMMHSSQLQELCQISSLEALKNIRDTLNAYIGDIEQIDNV